MKELNINRDTPQPSDEELLKHQNFDEVLQKSGVNQIDYTSKLVSKKWWYFGVFSFVVLGVVVLTINSYTMITNENKKLYNSDNQGITTVEKIENNIIAIKNNKLTVEDKSKTISDTQIVLEEKQHNIVKEPDTDVEYYYPKEASTLTFKLEESFGLKEQYQHFEEFSIYDNLAFQPIGDYQSGWLKASWNKVELVKKEGNYFLMLSKNGVSLPCQVVPVFESEDYVKALENYSNAKKK